MYPTEHPTTALVLAHYRLQEDIARAEAHRAARKAVTVRRSGGRAKAARTKGRSHVPLFGALRAALGRG